MKEIFGKYRDLESNIVYTVLKFTEDTVEIDTGKIVSSSSNYVTTCGCHLEPKDDNLEVFTFFDLHDEGIDESVDIHKIEATSYT